MFGLRPKTPPPPTIFHEAGEMFDHAAIELPGGVVGAFMEDDVLVVCVHANRGADPPEVDIRVDNAVIIRAKEKGRHRKVSEARPPV
jgi:hypothetical protein